MKKMKPFAILVLLSALAGCRTHSQLSWTPDSPTDSSRAIWQRPVSWPKLEKKPVYYFVKEIEEQANQKYDPDITIRYPLCTNAVFNPGVSAETSVLISMDSGKMPLFELLRLLCLGQRKLFFRDTSAILAEGGHGDGTGSVVLRGHCRDADTHDPIRRCALRTKRSLCVIDFSEKTSGDFIVRASRHGKYQLSIPVAMYWDMYQVDDQHISVPHPVPQDLPVTVVADGFDSQDYDVMLNTSNLTYELNIELRKTDSNNDLQPSK